MNFLVPQKNCLVGLTTKLAATLLRDHCSIPGRENRLFSKMPKQALWPI